MSLVDWYAAFWYMAKQWLWYSATILSPKLSLGIDIICVIILVIILRPILVIEYYRIEWLCPKNMQKEISLYRTTLFGVKLESKQLRKKERRKAYDFLYLLYPYLGPRNSSRTPRNRFWIPRSSKNVKLPFLDSSIPPGMKFFEELTSLMVAVSREEKWYPTILRVICL